MIVQFYSPEQMILDCWSFVLCFHNRTDRNKMLLWCSDHLKHRWEISPHPGFIRDNLFWLSVYNDNDAMLIKLTW